MIKSIGPVATLVIMGAAWGGTIPLAKIAVSGGYQHFGLIFWQLVITGFVLGALTCLRGKRLKLGAPHLGLYLAIALLGTILPNSASYQAAAHLPAGVVSILISLVPMFAFPIALALGNDRFHWLRFIGLVMGLIGVVLIVWPDSSLPDRTVVPWIFVGMIAPLFYAFEGNYVARWGTLDLDPIQTLFGASVVGAGIALPLAIGSGQWINPLGTWGAPDWALVASAILHAFAYSTYVWLVGRAGSVFAAQVAYFVTLFGIVWAMLFLGEVYGHWIWGALGLILLGVFFVQPRRTTKVVDAGRLGQSAAD
ncbi:MAG: DMT family transporter [Rhodobacteraceae bacterium]|nr:DMT family transporter [Paracoccaceae bacterium]